MQVVEFNREITFQQGKSLQTTIPADTPAVWSASMHEFFTKTPALKGLVKRSAPLDGHALYRPYQGQRLDGKHLLVWRHGGFGDLLFITPLLRQLKEDYPTCRITFFCHYTYQPILKGNPHIDHLYPQPIPASALAEADYHLHFQGTVEGSSDPDDHAVDLMARHAGVQLRNRVPVLVPNEDEKPYIDAILEDCLRTPEQRSASRIAVQVAASSPIRTYPWKALLAVCTILARRGHQVFLLGLNTPENVTGISPNLHDLCGHFPSMDQTAVFLRECDVVLAPDSSLVHVAGALGVRSVGLYGPFPGSARTRYYPECVTLEAKDPCAPCMIHGHKPCPEALTSHQYYSPCWSSVAPNLVAKTVEDQLSQGAAS